MSDPFRGTGRRSKSWKDLPKRVRDELTLSPSRTLAPCEARQFSDSMVCERCGLHWDTNDSDPPVCGLSGVMTSADFSFHTATKKLRAKPQQREKREVQQPLVVYLRKHLPEGSIVHAQAIQPLNENHRFGMQRDGVQFGMPDLLVIVPGDAAVRYLREDDDAAQTGFFFIECKHPDGGKLSPSQEHTQSLLIAMGCEVLRECRSVKEAVEWLKSRGVVFTNGV